MPSMRFEGCRGCIADGGFVGSGRKGKESEGRAEVFQVLYDRMGYADP